VCGPIPALLSLFFPNATWIESQQFILQIKKVGQILFLKRRGLFNAFPNLGRKVIKSATKEENFFSYLSKLNKKIQVNQGHQRGQQHKFFKSDFS